MMNFEDSTANQDWAENRFQQYSLCGHPGCGRWVPYNYDEDLCPEHELEADEDAMNDMLDAARRKTAWVLNQVLGHLAASSISMEEYLLSGRIIEEAIYETRFRDMKQ